MAAPNMKSPTTITGKSAAALATASFAALLSNAAASGKVLRVNMLFACNVHSTGAAATLECSLYDGSTDYRFIKDLGVYKGDPHDILNKPLYLMEGQSLRIKASATGSVEVVASYEEIS